MEKLDQLLLARLGEFQASSLESWERLKIGDGVTLKGPGCLSSSTLVYVSGYNILVDTIPDNAHSKTDRRVVGALLCPKHFGLAKKSLILMRWSSL